MTVLESKVALVTGAAQGIGLGIAERMRAAGAVVVVGDIQQPADGDSWVEFDVSSSESVQQGIDEFGVSHPTP